MIMLKDFRKKAYDNLIVKPDDKTDIRNLIKRCPKC